MDETSPGGQGLPGDVSLSKESEKHVAFANQWLSGVEIPSQYQDTSRPKRKAHLV